MPKDNLPAELTSFIGRQFELSELRRLLATNRLVTLTGPGGTGKTRLALQVAASLLDDPSTVSSASSPGELFPDGVWFVQLAALTDPALVLSTIAAVLAVPERSGQPLLDSLQDALCEKRLLLLLDNFEQLLDAASNIGNLLKAAPHLKVLVTSRIPLRLYGEKEFAVPPLQLPNLRDKLPIPIPMERVSQYEAVRLFIERAQDVQSNFDVTNEIASTLVEICTRLDGLPLAIELAAARVRLFSAPALLARLGQRLKLLTSGARDLDPRHQTLRAAIDWSYQLLTPDEQLLFRRMAVFQGGRTFPALEEVCAWRTTDDSSSRSPSLSVALRHFTNPQFDVLEGVESLVMQSLVQQRAGVDGEPRIWMLETIQEYAREKLEESGEGAALRNRHAAYFLALALQADPELRGPQQLAWLQRLDEEHDNLRAVLAWARERGPHDPSVATLGLRLAGSLWRFWLLRDYPTEGLAHLTDAVAAGSGEGVDPAARAKALNAAGNIATDRADFDLARSFYEQALALLRETGDRRGMALPLGNLGMLAVARGDFEAARALTEESLALYRERGEPGGISLTLTDLGRVAAVQGHFEEARPLVEEALALGRESGDLWRIASALDQLGVVSFEQGKYELARIEFEEALALRRKLGHRAGIAQEIANVGRVAAAQGETETARALLEESLTLFRELQDLWGVANSLEKLAVLEATSRDYRTAHAQFEKATALYREQGERRGIAACLAGLGSVLAEHGELEGMSGRDGRNKGNSQLHRAARVLGATAALLANMGAVLELEDRSLYERAVAMVREVLGEETFAQTWAEGQALPLDDAIALALQPLPEAPVPAPTQQSAAPSYPGNLSRREVEVLRLAAQGMSNAEVAGQLSLSERTVESHLRNIYSKLGVLTRVEAARFAFEHGLL